MPNYPLTFSREYGIIEFIKQTYPGSKLVYPSGRILLKRAKGIFLEGYGRMAEDTKGSCK